MILSVLHAKIELGMENQGTASLSFSHPSTFFSLLVKPHHKKKLKVYLFPERSRSNPSFIFSKGKTWVINGSSGNFLAIKSATSLGTESLLLKPEKEVTSMLDSARYEENWRGDFPHRI